MSKPEGIRVSIIVDVIHSFISDFRFPARRKWLSIEYH